MLKIDVDVVFTPVELAYLAAEASQRSEAQDLLGWLKRRNQQAGGSLLIRPRNFKKTKLAETIDLFSNNRKDPTKKLLIAFVGAGGMFMMPKPLFLQQFRPSLWDIVFVHPRPAEFENSYDLSKMKPKRQKHYYDVGSYSRTAKEFADQISSLVDRREYDKLICTGASAGGGIAMHVSQHLEADLGIGIGARVEDDEVITLPSTKAKNLVAIYSELFIEDETEARILRHRLGATPVSIPGIKRHNPFKKAIRASKLDSIFPDIFDPDKDIHQTIQQYAAVMGVDDEDDT